MCSVSDTEDGEGTWSEDMKPAGSQSCWDSAAHRSGMSFPGPVSRPTPKLAVLQGTSLPIKEVAP